MHNFAKAMAPSTADGATSYNAHDYECRRRNSTITHTINTLPLSAIYQWSCASIHQGQAGKGSMLCDADHVLLLGISRTFLMIYEPLDT